MRSAAQIDQTLLDVEGAVDLHCHPFPDLFPRLADDDDIAAAAAAAGMKAIVFKCHHESTVSRAYHVQKHFPELHVFGGIVLNSYVGFLNAAAVEAALRLGGKVVWMPTIDAGFHEEVHGSTGAYEAQVGGAASAKGIWILDERGELRPELFDILDLVVEHNAILGTCHLSPKEIVALVSHAAARGVEKIVVTHPFFKVPNLDLGTLEELARLGAYPEFGYCTISPAWHYAIPEKIVEAIRRVGASRCLLVSDAGQRHNPLPHEALRIFAQIVFEKGIPLTDVNQMIKSTPLDLLDVRKPIDRPLPMEPQTAEAHTLT